VGISRLRDSRNYERWVPAARWAARFHAATRNLPPAVTSFLPSYDAAHYQRCAERVGKILPGLNVSDRALVTRALDQYLTHLDWFAALPRTVVHGQFFGKNIMLRVRRGDRMLAVIDWETAALGPGGFDLVSLSSGRWTASERQTMWRAYFDEYQACTGLLQD
jgi:aminoglycoside phosphotransferase (APT) family kinase protein